MMVGPHPFVAQTRFFFLLCSKPIGPVGSHYRSLMVGPVGVEGNDGGPSPVRGRLIELL